MAAALFILILLGAACGILAQESLRGTRDSLSVTLARLRAVISGGSMANLQRQAAAEVRRLAIVSISASYLPNDVVVRISPVDGEVIRGLEREFADGVRSLLAAITKQRPGAGDLPFRLLGKLDVRVVVDERTPRGTVKVDASVLADTRLAMKPDDRQEVLELALEDRRVPLTGTLVVGRASNVDVRLPEHSVSHRHAELVCRGMSVTVQDLDSSNGTTVNGVPVTKRGLRVGDRVTFGAAATGVVELGAGACRVIGLKTQPLDFDAGTPVVGR
jgi:hypothetical protein